MAREWQDDLIELLASVSGKQDAVLAQQSLILEQMGAIMATLDAQNAAVQANTDATNAAVAALTSGATDQAGVDANTAQIQANTDALNAAVTPPPPPAP